LLRKVKRKALVFDLDGTLVDSVPDLAAAVNAALAERDAAPLSEAAVQRMVGDGAPALAARALAASGLAPDGDGVFLARFLAYYEAEPTARTRPYPGVTETLSDLAERGCRLAVCTNKPEAATRLVLAGLGLDRFFGAVLGGDSTPWQKPDARHLLAAVAALGAAPSEAVMIGDNENDAGAAKAAGIPLVLVAYGYARVPVETLAADRLIQSFEELGAALASL
jgi:phosphoglycolate phosphatase